MSNFDNLSDYKKAEAVQLLNSWFWIKRAVIAVTMFIVLLVAGCPSYSVYQQGMSGKAELERAKQNGAPNRHHQTRNRSAGEVR